MKIISTEMEGLYVLEPRVFGDDRGYFMETFRSDLLQEAGIMTRWVQDNEAFSRKGALRGLHYQLPPMAQSKLVRVVHGEVQDIVVDIRPGSETYGKYFSITLSAENKKQLLVPRGMAHGYLTVSDEAVFVYKCDNYYSKEQEAGINPLDKELELPWQSIDVPHIFSEKDRNQPAFGDHRKYQVCES